MNVVDGPAAADYEADLARYATELAGREWLFDAVERWAADASARRLLIVGSPGVGKSAFSAALVKRRDDVAAYHFCDTRRGGSLVPSSVAGSLCAQLSRKLPGFADAVLACAAPRHAITGSVTIDGSIVGARPAIGDPGATIAAGVYARIDASNVNDDAFETQLRLPLQRIAAPPKPVFIVVNALDRALAYGGKHNLVELIAGTDDFPPWVRWICTMCPNDDVTFAFPAATPAITIDSDRNREDLRVYTHGRLGAPELEERVVAAADQSFLYAKMLLDNAASPEALRAQLLAPPQGIFGSFRDLLRDLGGLSPGDAMQSVLATLAVAQGPLDKERLAGIARSEQRAIKGAIETLRPVLDAVPGPDGATGYTFFHQAFRDFLLDDASGPYQVAAKDAHSAIATYCLLERDAYAWRWLSLHLANAKRTADLRALLLDPDYLAGKMAALEPSALLADFDYVPDDVALQAIRGALRLSAGVLVADPSQFAAQLIGRLMPYGADPAIGAFSEALVKRAPAVWLRPLGASLQAPGGPMLYALRGHAGDVTDVAVTPDGATAVSGSYDCSIGVWDLERGTLRARLAIDAFAARSVAVTSDGAMAIAGYNDGKAVVWDLRAGTLAQTWHGHRDTITAIALAGDGALAITASDDTTLKLWDLASGTERATLAGHSRSVGAVAASADGRIAVSGSGDTTLIVWDLAAAKALRTLTGHAWAVRGVALGADGRRCVSASNDGTLRVWDVASGAATQVLRGHKGWVNAVAMTADGTRAVSAGQDGTVRVWDLETGSELGTLTGHLAPVTSVAVTADARRAVSGSNDRTCIAWSLAGSELAAPVDRHERAVHALAIAPGGVARVVSASSDTTLRVWLPRGGAASRVLRGHTGAVKAVATTPDGRRAVSASWDETAIVWDLERETALVTLRGHTGGLNGAAIFADGKRVLTCSDDTTLRSWDVESGETLAILQGHGGFVNAVLVAPGERNAVSGASDGRVIMWDLVRGRAAATFEGHTGPVTCLAQTEDGTRVVTGSEDATVRVWNATAPPVVLYGHASIVNAVIVVPGSRFAATASEDATVRLWDLEGGGASRELRGHTARVVALDAAPDGRTICSASGDGTLRVWRVADGAPLAAFTADFALTCCRYVDAETLVAGDERGFVHLLSL